MNRVSHSLVKTMIRWGELLFCICITNYNTLFAHQRMNESLLLLSTQSGGECVQIYESPIIICGMLIWFGFL